LLKHFNQYHKENAYVNKEPDFKDFLIETPANKLSKKTKDVS